MFSQDRERIQGVMDDIQRIADEGSLLLSDAEVPREKMLRALASLMEENHAHLDTLGVSHPSLEEIREVTSSFGLSTKLTGAGGGGCAVTLVPDGVLSILNSGYKLMLVCWYRFSRGRPPTGHVEAQRGRICTVPHHDRR